MKKADREKMVRRMFRRFKGTHLANPLVSWFVQAEVDRAVRAEREKLSRSNLGIRLAYLQREQANTAEILERTRSNR